MQKGGGGPVQGTKGKPASASMREKPGFPSAGLPGKAGPDRSAGVHKSRQHPKSEGL